MTDYKELSKRLREYSAERRGEIADLTYEAAVAIGVLEGRVKMLEQEIEVLKMRILDLEHTEGQDELSKLQKLQ